MQKVKETKSEKRKIAPCHSHYVNDAEKRASAD